ncbi:MAG: MBL fold metallo-hydrolase [Chitinivibrionales bacterium]|nr:MBL fold metallo-hydrolase [Chitinivibrionales bacterium]
MYIKCWGSRGSIPVSGQQFRRYGGDTTCMEIRSKNGDIIVVDAGSGIRALGNKLVQEKVKHFTMLFTHAHWDHILGFPFFHPVYQKGVTISIKGCPFNLASYREILRGLMSPPYFPVGLEAIKAKLQFSSINQRAFRIGSIKVRPIFISHPNGGLGFRFEEGKKSFVFLTDNELGYIHDMGLEFGAYVDFCNKTDLLIHDAEFDKRSYKLFRLFGHSQYTDAVDLAVKAEVGQFGLFHLNKESTDDTVDAMVKDAHKIISKSQASVRCFAVGNRFEISL